LLSDSSDATFHPAEELYPSSFAGASIISVVFILHFTLCQSWLLHKTHTQKHSCPD
jgi:hypothetical protein